MAGKFEIYKDKIGDYRFRLKAGNGEIILASEGYKSKASCENGIVSVMKNASEESHYQKIETKNDKFAFNLLAANYQVIGSSQSYVTTASRDIGIASVMKNAPEAKIVELEA